MVDSSPAITLSFPFTLRDRLRAGFALIPQRKLSMVLAAALPLMGLALLIHHLVAGRTLGTGAWLIIVICLLSFPAILLIGIVASHFGNKHLREPFTYSFDDAGIHVSAVSYEYTHRWSTISHVKPFAGFLMFFFSPGCAHCIPLKIVDSAGVREPLLALAKSQGAHVDGVSPMAAQ